MAFPDSELGIGVYAFMPASTDLSSRLLNKDIVITRGRTPGQASAQAAQCVIWLDNSDFALTPLLATSTYYPLWDLGTLIQLTLTNVGSSPPYTRFRGFAADISEFILPGEGGTMRAVRVTVAGALRRLGRGADQGRLARGAAPRSALWRTINSAATSNTFVCHIPLEGAVDAAFVVGSGSTTDAIDGPAGSDGAIALTGTASITLPVQGGAASGETVRLQLLPVRMTDTATMTGAFTFNVRRTVSGPTVLSGPVVLAWSSAGSGTVTVTGLTAAPLSATSDLFDGDWHDIAVSISTGFNQVDLFIDGTVVATAATSPTTTAISEIGPSAELMASYVDGSDSGQATVGVCHLSVHTAEFMDMADAGTGYVGEAAGTRAARLCDEADIARGVTTSGEGVPLGVQQVATVPDLLRDVEWADHGHYDDATNTFGVNYLTSTNRYNLAAALAIDLSTYNYGEDGPGPEQVLAPVRNDQRIRNRWLVSRPGGAVQTYSDSTHITAHGLYEDSTTVNVETDADAMHDAGWRVHEGTWEGLRQQVIPLDLGANAGLIQDWLDITLGDRVDRTNLVGPSTSYPVSTESSVLDGYQETLNPHGWVAQVAVTPYSPWQVNVLAEDDPANDDPAIGWLDHDSCVLTSAVTAGATTWTVTCDPPDTIDADDFPRRHYIGGELVTVTEVRNAGLDLPGTSGAYASTPDAAALDIIGDIDIRVNVALDDWDTGAEQALVAKYTTTGNQRSYRLMISTAGNLELRWSTDGATTSAATCTVTPASVFTAGQRVSIRVALDVDDGGGNRVTTFYSSTDTDLSTATWTQLGSTVTTAGTTSIFSGTATANVGAYSDGTAGPAGGTIYAAQIRNGIAGAIRANPEFTAEDTGTTSFADSAGRTWTVNGTALLVGPSPAQAWTVTRSVNGVTKSHSSSAEIELADPLIMALS